MLCSRCKTTLPAESQFCLKCGEPVPVAAANKRFAAAVTVPAADDGTIALLYPRRRRSGRYIVWFLLLAVIGFLLWATFSDHPFAQQFQEAVGWSHALAATDGNFTVSPHNFTYYKFTVPAGAMNVFVGGQFNVTGNSSTSDGVEAYVLTETAFPVWQNGYATTNYYESGRVAGATVNAQLPAGAGVYYFVFSNRFSPRTAKTVSANLLLHYKSWLPEWLRLLKDRFWNWVGL